MPPFFEPPEAEAMIQPWFVCLSRVRWGQPRVIIAENSRLVVPGSNEWRSNQSDPGHSREQKKSNTKASRGGTGENLGTGDDCIVITSETPDPRESLSNTIQACLPQVKGIRVIRVFAEDVSFENTCDRSSASGLASFWIS
ncbi:hypothetical protein N7462_005700 [Penicillium macrosclerotiorum]|uniref:uncharacterized protein n=1 Tax=Penicillium macrosclerotiorum TaxID=303699 RepID=UPI0025470781|nr:uncharacterized protein N7462_005700 [Penicillium macrosclerotiorum]KAJ5682535.1 hypothetical protein N7462_005700 [Penicillium macrosclerotiorum]